jgi:hypothetical protein
VGPVVRSPVVVAVRVHRNNRIVLTNVDAVVPSVTRVPAPFVVGVVPPAGILKVSIVQRIHGCVRCGDSQTGTTGSEAYRNREASPGILSGHGVRAPGGRESDQEIRSHHFGHDVFFGRSYSDQLDRPCDKISKAGDLYLLRANDPMGR